MQTWTTRKRGPISHIVIPDTQVRPGVPLAHLDWAAQYVREREPDVLVMLGDWWDMPSLSSYDRGTRAAEGRRIARDIDAGNEAMERFLAPMRRHRRWWRRLTRVFLLGNHEERIVRYSNEHPETDGVVSLSSLFLDDWRVFEFLDVAKIDGVAYSHLFPRSASGAITQTKRGAPSARAQCVRQGGSATAGHQQGLDLAPVVLGERLQWGLICGSFYLHDEAYLSPQGHTYWKGLVVKHDVHDGGYSPMLVDMPYLKRRFSNRRSKR